MRSNASLTTFSDDTGAPPIVAAVTCRSADPRRETRVPPRVAPTTGMADVTRGGRYLYVAVVVLAPVGATTCTCTAVAVSAAGADATIVVSSTTSNDVA